MIFQKKSVVRLITGVALLQKYLRTLSFLGPKQLFAQVHNRCKLFLPAVSSTPRLRAESVQTVWQSSNPPSLVSRNQFRFLNETHVFDANCNWNDHSREVLWLYNLHYFDDLIAVDADERTKCHRALVDRWVRENPPVGGFGWDPYPTSKRIVNWIKWASGRDAMETSWLDSLAQQARWLRRRLEYHLLGNHLLANAKALIFAGVFFEGGEADEWLEKGLSILEKEIPEQILADGGHFERSPMYHSIIFEDMLDLVNLFGGCTGLVGHERVKRIADEIRSYGVGMVRWLRAMCHPDGEIGFFNDAAFGIAPKPAALFDYAARLGLECGAPPEDGVTHLPESGYIRYQKGPVVALLDVAPVGPDYQPGHAHADTLSFELSLFGQRVFVNSGTSTYEEGEERHRQRGTAAHNTVEIDGENSSEVWKSFRVARRAYPKGLEIEEGTEEVWIACEHDGYERLKGRSVHRREWSFGAGSLAISDEVRSRLKAAPTGIVASFHLHPDVIIERVGDGALLLRLVGGEAVHLECSGASLRLEDATWHPEFGLSIPNKVIRCDFGGVRATSTISWQAV